MERAERKIRASNERALRVREALAALYLRKLDALAIRHLTAISDMVFHIYETPKNWTSFEPNEKLLWKIAYGLYRQCLQTNHEHLIARVRRYVRVLASKGRTCSTSS